MPKFFQSFIFCFTTLVFLSSTTWAKEIWDLNDVSILFPLPENGQPDLLLPLENLISEKTVLEFPRLSVRYDEKVILRALRVVAFRIDADQQKIKLVWQPLLPGPGSQFRALDMALHSFYQLSTPNFRELLNQLLEFKKIATTRGLPLQVHPAFTGPHKTESIKFITTLIQKYASVQNLTKITAMVLRGGDDMWAFSGFDVVDSKLVPIRIAFTGNSTAQLFVNQAVPSTNFDNFNISPLQAPTADVFTDSLLGASLKIANGKVLSEEEVLKTMNSLFKFENPLLSAVDDVDCVSCHVSQPLRHWLKTKSPTMTLANEYKNPNFNLGSTHTTALNTVRIRGFGYFGTEPALSERVINESAEVATALNKLFN